MLHRQRKQFEGESWLALCQYLALFLGLSAAAFVQGNESENVDFDRDVRPILSEYCFHCHGPDSNTREAGLRLDTEEGLFKERDGLIAVVAGRSDRSSIIERMLAENPLDIMPPPETKRKMSAEEIELVKQWIDSGAEWVEHWAYRPMQEVKPSSTEVHPIDSFLAESLQAEGLTFSDEAPRSGLLRRLSLDLTGLPPTIEQVEAYENDTSPDAYERVVERLLASKHYGERMAWNWLEAARYADTDGFQGDPTRDMWPWRDWLIDALNANKPFDEFTIELLAGDLLLEANEEQVLASGFNRNHSYNNEGGRIPEETRVENVMDRLETTSTIWMGLTMNCARCHDHKYDPISQKEYFELYDFFNQTSESGIIQRGRADPVLVYLSESSKKKVSGLKIQIHQLEQTIESRQSEFLAERPNIREEMQKRSVQVSWRGLVPTKLRAQSQVPLITTVDGGFRTNAGNLESDVYEISSETELQTLRSLRLDALPFDDYEPKGLSNATHGRFTLSEIEIKMKPKGADDTEYKAVRIERAEATSMQEGNEVHLAFDRATQTGWAIAPKRGDEVHSALFVFDESYYSPSGFEIQVNLAFQAETSYRNLARGRLLVSSHKEQLDETQLPWDIVSALRVPEGNRSHRESKILKEYERARYFPKLTAQLQSLENQIASTRKRSPHVMVMDELSADEKRETKILSGGIFNAPTGEAIEANTPSFLPPFPEVEDRNRLTFAEWLVDPEHPLTARVTVNRYWQLFFGRGLVESAGDFGSQGDKPTHPELLDWLAREFVRSGWDVKAMHRLIVTSKAYRQASRVKAETLENDPKNSLLSYAPRHRMPSWMLRDQALSLAGLLNDTMGGKGVFPYQPEGVWLDATLGKKAYKEDTDERIYRRSIYIFWKRISGPTMLFDSAKRQECEVLPSRTNTPLHALTTLNEPMFIEAARKLAERVLAQPKEERIRHAFRLTVSREPYAHEISSLTDQLDYYQRVYEESPSAAQELLSVGNAPSNEEYARSELAAWAAVCNVLLNLDETQNIE